MNVHIATCNCTWRNSSAIAWGTTLLQLGPGRDVWPVACPPIELQLHVSQRACNCKCTTRLQLEGVGCRPATCSLVEVPLHVTQVACNCSGYNAIATGGDKCYAVAYSPLELQLDVSHHAYNCKGYNTTATGEGGVT